MGCFLKTVSGSGSALAINRSESGHHEIGKNTFLDIDSDLLLFKIDFVYLRQYFFYTFCNYY
jgi:hypothetical protein